MSILEKIYQEVINKAVDDGLLIESGWVALRSVILPPVVSAKQVEDLRDAFFCGAQHLFASLFGVLSPGGDITEEDMARVGKVSEELSRYVDDLKKRLAKAEENKGKNPGCSTRSCNDPVATHRVFWPGSEPMLVCLAHHRQAEKVAQAMGFRLASEVYSADN